MPPQAFAYALAAAFVHASWNVLLARDRDVQAATAGALAVGVLVFAPVAAAVWNVEAAAVPFIVGSAAFELAYVALLAAAYRRADLSLVYPLTRGAAPVLVLRARCTRRVRCRRTPPGAWQLSVAAPGQPNPSQRQRLLELEHGHPIACRRRHEPRHDGNAESRHHQGLDGAVVVGAVDDVRLNSSLPHVVLHLSRVPGPVCGDERELGKSAHRQRPGHTGERRPCGDDHYVRLGEQLHHFERPPRNRQHRKAHVQRAGLQEADEVEVGHGLGELDAKTGSERPPCGSRLTACT
jgi:hypothetical protein